MMDALREEVPKVLVHRNYSFYTAGMRIQITMYINRLEVKNPRGLFGRSIIDQLGQVQSDTSNPVLIIAMENLGKTENRCFGPIRTTLKKC